MTRGVSWPRSVRLRSTLAATAVVAVALIVGALVLMWLLRASLTRAVHASAELRAQDVATQLAGEGTAPLDLALSSRPSEQSIVQVIDRAGVVVAASPAIAGETPLSTARPAPGQTVATTTSLPVGGQEPFFVVARGVHASGGDFVVIAAESTASVQQSVETVAVLLALGFPALLFVVGAAVYIVVGRSLRPVERMRTQVAGITLADLSQRVPDPQTADEISRLAGTMNDMLSRLQHSQRAQRAFIADASHELRSPLAAVRANVEVVRTSDDVDEWKQTGDAVLAETDRLDHLVDDLLLLARADEHGLVARQHDVDLDDILLAERDRLRRTTSLTVTAQVEPCRVRGDRRQLERLVRNLCDNAARYAATTVRLKIRHDTHQQIVITVEDDGPGIPAWDHLRVFERFVRLDQARDRRGGGSGLGLAIVREVAHAHGGEVTIADASPGARFEVRLPALSAGD